MSTETTGLDPNTDHEKPISQEQVKPVVAEQYALGSWDALQEELMDIEDKAFNGRGFSLGEMKWLFEDDRAVNYLLKNNQTGKIIGYTSVQLNGDTAYIANTAIIPTEQHKGYVGLLMREVENELRSRGVLYLERDAAVENGYADKIQKNYKDRIIEEPSERMSPWGVQRHFKIKL